MRSNEAGNIGKNSGICKGTVQYARQRVVLCTVLTLVLVTVFFAASYIQWREPMEPHLTYPGAIGGARQSTTTLLQLAGVQRPYFVDQKGKAVYLTGSHTWNNFQEIRRRSDDDFDFDKYLKLLKDHNHNFIRLWVWEQAAWAPWTVEKLEFYPLPYVRSGPGEALDGKPKFNLMRFNKEFFDRLRSRVAAAQAGGIYVSVMLFQGWSVGKKPDKPGNPWRGHPFNRANNVNSIDGDADGNGEGKEIETLSNPSIMALQESYVREVIGTLSDFDNVLWEIGNETDPEAKEWQYHMINFIKRHEAASGKRHPVGMTAMWPNGKNSDLFQSSADWISPNDGADWHNIKETPPAANSDKVVLVDTDHIWGVGGDRQWIWKCFLRGLNPIFMDPYGDPGVRVSERVVESCRRAMGHTLTYARRINLTAMAPRSDLATSGYCLADEGKEYLVYIIPPSFGKVRLRSKPKTVVDFSATHGTFGIEWFNPLTGEVRQGVSVEGGNKIAFTAPFRGEALLHILREELAGKYQDAAKESNREGALPKGENLSSRTNARN